MLSSASAGGRGLIDAICQITGTTEQYSSAIPEPFTLSPRTSDPRLGRRQHRQLVSRTVRPSGARHGPGSGAEQPAHGLAAELHLLNSSHVRNKIEQSAKLLQLMRQLDKLAPR